jgi:hypothetical protein
LARLGKSGPDPRPDSGTYEYVVPGTGEKVRLPKGVQYGWDYAPGKTAAETALSARKNRLETLSDKDEFVARRNVAALVGSQVFARFFAGGMKGEFPVAVIGQADRAAFGAQSPVVLLSQESLAAHITRHPEIGLADYRNIQGIIDTGEVYRQGDARLIYLTVGGTVYRAVLKRTADGKKNYFLTLFRNDTGARPKPDTRVR